MIYGGWGFIVREQRNTNETVMEISNKRIGGSYKHVDPEIKFIVKIEKERIDNVSLNKNFLIKLATKFSWFEFAIQLLGEILI